MRKMGTGKWERVTDLFFDFYKFNKEFWKWGFGFTAFFI